jgi:glutamate synthase (NADPH/NADH) small chain
MDAVRTSLRLGAEKAMIVYRRSEVEMPARREEIEHAKQEGVIFMNLYNPIEYLADETGHVTTMRLQHMELGEPDESGRCRPVPIEGDTLDVPVDEVIVSIGVRPNPIIPTHFEGLKITPRGTIEVDLDKGQSDLGDVFAGGDIVRGGATVILAMGDGRTAASGIDHYLTEQRDEQ